MGVCWSTSTNPTLANSHTSDGNRSSTFVSRLTGLIQATPYYVRAYATNSVGTAYGNEVIFSTLTLTPCSPASITKAHVAGAVAPVTKTVTYGTVTNIPGETSKCWITSNLGADHQAIDRNDPTEASAGWYWQFNRMQGYKHDGTTRTPNSTWITSISEDSDWTAANDPCSIELGGGWRIPTNTEWTNVNATGGWIDWNGPWNSGLSLHAAGQIYNGSLYNTGTYGIYWSNNQAYLGGGYLLFIASYECVIDRYPKADGYSLRCIK